MLCGKLVAGAYIVSEPAKTRTRGAPLKANKLEARIAFRASQELVDWLKRRRSCQRNRCRDNGPPASCGAKAG